MTTPNAASRIQIFHVPDCPLVDRLITELEGCLTTAELSEPVELLVGDYPSPSLVIDGIDITTGSPMSGQPSCRLDLPTRAQIDAALGRLVAKD
jgi:hypothetical protein